MMAKGDERNLKKPPFKNQALKCDYSSSVYGDNCDENLLILLHGVGDNCRNFINLGKKMNLPQTAICSIQGNCIVPFFDDAHSWYESFTPTGDLLLKPTDEEMKRACTAVSNFIKANLLEYFPRERIFLLGFGQGGQVASTLALMENFGGCISISGLPSPTTTRQMTSKDSSSSANNCLINTPMLITFGQLEDNIPSIMKDITELERRLGISQQHSNFSNKLRQLEYHAIPGKGIAPPGSSKVEMKAIMKFLAKKLNLRSLALEESADLIQVN